jgi:hypothetical protein
MRSKTKANDLIASQILKTCANGASETRITHQSSPNSMKVISYLLLIDEHAQYYDWAIVSISASLGMAKEFE